MPKGSDTELQGLLDLANRGDREAHGRLLDHACERLLKLTRAMFAGYPSLRRWEQTDDVFVNSMMRLHRALEAVQPESVQQASNDANGTLQRRASEPEDLSAWSLFHEQVERLPDELRETFNLLYYEGLSQEESANVLGVSVSTVKRRWQEARVRLHDELGETT